VSKVPEMKVAAGREDGQARGLYESADLELAAAAVASAKMEQAKLEQ
jgi:hypothetical protein